MQNDFLRDLELLGVTARLKRLSDALTTSIKELYRQQGVDIEPSWHLVLLFLQEREATQAEIAASLHLSQPAMTKMIQRMVARGYLEVRPDQEDGRRKIIRLSRLARRRLPVFERIWSAGQAAVGEILGADAAFLRHLQDFESQIAAKDFSQRASEYLDDGRAARPAFPTSSRP